jgi:hypothetical protein
MGLLTIHRYGFGAYFNILPGSEWSAIMLTYGFPLAIIGMALKVCFLGGNGDFYDWHLSLLTLMLKIILLLIW